VEDSERLPKRIHYHDGVQTKQILTFCMKTSILQCKKFSNSKIGFVAPKQIPMFELPNDRIDNSTAKSHWSFDIVV